MTARSDKSPKKESSGKRWARKAEEQSRQDAAQTESPLSFVALDVIQREPLQVITQLFPRLPSEEMFLSFLELSRKLSE
jgi:hypothetical protein